MTLFACHRREEDRPELAIIEERVVEAGRRGADGGAKGVTDDRLKADVRAAIGANYTIDTAAETKQKDKDDLGGFLDFMKYAMLGFAGIAVLVGIFLIVNTFSMLVAQRTREIGLMRAIGSSRRQINRSVLVEAVLLGVVGSVAGIGAGIGLAVGLIKLMGALGMHLNTADLTIKAATPLIGLTVVRHATPSIVRQES